MIAAIKGYSAVLTMPDKVSQEKQNALKAFGAKIVVTPTSAPPDSAEHYVNVAKRIAAEIPNSFRIDQYDNPKNPEAHYYTTGPEIWQHTQGQCDIFIASGSTGGTVSGIGKFLKEKNPNLLDIMILEHSNQLKIILTMIIAALVDNINTKKPNGIDSKAALVALWDNCKSEIEVLSQVIFNNKLGNFSLLDIYKEKYENKLALFSQNSAVKKLFENLNLKDKYSYLGEKIQNQFEKGLARNQALRSACYSIFTYNTHRALNADCWEKILKYLPQEDLKNVTKVASLFFKKSPSNDSYNFSSAKQSSKLHFNP